MENLRNKEINLDKLDIVKKNIPISSLIVGTFNEYKIKEDELLLNPYNDRFAKERYQSEDFNENNSYKILFSKKIQDKIADLIWNIDVKRNKVTLKDIENIGMRMPIVIDKSFLVIDGNRRVTIIRKILKRPNLSFEQRNKLEKINCIVIPEILDKPKISDYETKLQMGEDPKLDYDPINRYLKINKLLEERKSKGDLKYKEVADLMGTKFKINDIKTHEKTFKIMQNYLNFIGKKNNYMELDHREDQFKAFANFWNNFENNKLNNDNFNFKDEKIHFDIIKICYALINQQVEGKIFRTIFPNVRNILGPLTSKKSIEYLKNQLKIDKTNNEDFKIWANNKDLNFSKEDLKLIIEKSKIISSNVNKEYNQLNEKFINDVLNKIDRLDDKLKDSKDKSHNKKFLKLIEKIKYKVNEIINAIKKDKY